MVDPVSSGGGFPGGSSAEAKFNSACNQLESAGNNIGQIRSALEELKQLAQSDHALSSISPLLDKQLATLSAVGNEKLLPLLARSFASSIKSVAAGAPISEVMGEAVGDPRTQFNSDIIQIFNSPAFNFITYGTPSLTQAQFKTDLGDLFIMIQEVTTLLSNNYLTIAQPSSRIPQWDSVLYSLIAACQCTGVQAIIDNIPDSSAPASISKDITGQLSLFLSYTTSNAQKTSAMQMIIRMNLVPGIEASAQMKALNVAIAKLESGTGSVQTVISVMSDAAQTLSQAMKLQFPSFATNFATFFSKALANIQSQKSNQAAMLLVISKPMNYINILLNNPSMENPATWSSPYEHCADLQQDVGSDGWQKELYGNATAIPLPDGVPTGSLSKMSQLFLYYIENGGVNDFSNLSSMLSSFTLTMPWDPTDPNPNPTQVSDALNSMLSVFSNM